MTIENMSNEYTVVYDKNRTVFSVIQGTELIGDIGTLEELQNEIEDLCGKRFEKEDICDVLDGREISTTQKNQMVDEHGASFTAGYVWGCKEK